MDLKEALDAATASVLALIGHDVDVLVVKKPRDIQAAVELSKIISKLSPIIGNLLEYTVVQYLNSTGQWPPGCTWIRQDPDFPDALLSGMPQPRPGIEIKTWFPLATEITARFHDSQALLTGMNTRVALVAWVPEFVISGQPRIMDVWVGDAMDVAEARDLHYHKPPDYLVVEPEDTTLRTRNLQQKNCNGYRFQGDGTARAAAAQIVASWGPGGGQLLTRRPLIRRSSER